MVAWAGAKLAVIDCFGVLDDAKIRRYFELGEVKVECPGFREAFQGPRAGAHSAD